MRITETHFHLDYLKNDSAENILEQARKNGVDRFVTISVSPDNMNKAMQLAQNFEDVFFTQGIHPHEAKLCTSEVLAIIRSRLNEKKLVAIGEIGLDYHYDKSPRDIQQQVFKDHLKIAIDAKMPVVIHSRDADEDMIQILQEYSPKMKKKGVVHSFTSGPELAHKALELDFYLGFNGIITFKNAHAVRKIVEITPIEKILVETDSPFLTPVPHRGKENTPAYLPHVIKMIAQIKNIQESEVARITYQNATDLFFS